jgi:hypothetical protein
MPNTRRACLDSAVGLDSLRAARAVQQPTPDQVNRELVQRKLRFCFRSFPPPTFFTGMDSQHEPV